jgi:hypothetical protein
LCRNASNSGSNYRIWAQILIIFLTFVFIGTES